MIRPRPQGPLSQIDDMPGREVSIEAEAQAELQNSAYHSVRQVTCQLEGGVLRLQGRVPSFFMKQVAQSVLLHRLEGMVVIDNRLEVGTENAG